jgi:hypothetical protein
LGRNEEESVDFADRFGPTEQAEEIDKHLDRLDFEIREARGFGPRGCSEGGHGRKERAEAGNLRPEREEGLEEERELESLKTKKTKTLSY